METSSGNPLRPWVFGGVALVIAVVGLFVAISAKGDSVDGDKIVQELTEQLKGELTGVGGKLAEASEASARADRIAARDRRRMKRTVDQAVEGEKRTNALKAELKSLQSQVADLKDEEAKTRESVAATTERLDELEAEVRRNTRRLEKIG